MSAASRKVLVTGPDLAPAALDILRDYEVVFVGKTPVEADILAACQAHDPVAIILRMGGVSLASMQAAPSLKVISKHGVGIDSVDKAAAAARGIAVRVATGANAAAVAEHSLALMLACAKSVTQLDERMRQGHWDKSSHKSLELGGRTLGLVGLGAIGLRFARMAEAMDMRVIGFDPYAQNLPAYVEPVPLAQIWERSDVVSLHCPLTEDNRRMVNAQTLAACKPGVIVVNTARGGLIDEAALLAAVQSGQVRSAGLDSFAEEPYAKGHMFSAEKRIVLSPHIGGVTSDAYLNMGRAAALNVRAVLESLEPAAA